MTSDGAKVFYRLWPVLGLCLALAAGCDKSSNQTEQPTVAMVGGDVNPNGTISPEGLKKIEARSAEPKLTVVFFRSHLSDAGLNQLAKFPNIRRVEAIGSRVTPAGIQKLKRAIPEVEVAN